MLDNSTIQPKKANTDAPGRFSDLPGGLLCRGVVQDKAEKEEPAPRTGDAFSATLSTAHIRPRASFEAYLKGALISVHRPKLKNGQIGGGKRGIVGDFSRGSRRRMLRKMAMTERRCKPAFMTLTFPQDWPGSPREWKRLLKIFIQRLERAYPECGGVWKLEPQKRGAPHFHMLVWDGFMDMRRFNRWVADNWYQIVGSGDRNHWLWHMGLLGQGNKPCVGSIKSERGVMGYAGKYVAKVADDYDLDPALRAAWSAAGRWWGVWGADNIPWAEVVTIGPSDPQINSLFRYMRRYAHLKGRSSWQSLTIFVDDPGQWLRCVYPDS